MKPTLSLSKEKIKILLLENIHPQARTILNQSGYHNVESIDVALSQTQLIEKIQTVHMLGIRSRSVIDQKILDHADKLIAILNGEQPLLCQSINWIQAVSIIHSPIGTIKPVSSATEINLSG